MKEAKLPSGKIVMFSDDTPDHEIDRVVRTMLGATTVIDPAVASKLFSETFQSLLDAYERMEERLRDMENRISSNNRMMTGYAANNEKTASALVAIDKTLATLSKRNNQSEIVAEISGLAKSMRDSIKAFGDVAKTLKPVDGTKTLLTAISEMSQHITAAINAPKEITRDKEGRPTGIRIK